MPVLIQGDAQHIPLLDGSVHMAVTSIPYYTLRSYGVPPSIWGGDPGCDHDWSWNAPPVKRSHTDKGTSTRSGPNRQQMEGGTFVGRHAFCQKCGAWLGCLGLEPSVELYVEHIVSIFEEVWRVLRPGGTLWLNIGDSYAGSGRGWQKDGKVSDIKRKWLEEYGYGSPPGYISSRQPNGLKPKDMMGIPWTIALALRAAGWWLRSDIIWCLSGGTWLYARTQNGDGPMMVKDVARLDPATVQLWNGRRWTQLLGANRNGRQGTELELVLRSGERISCTPSHKFPTQRGLVEAGEIGVGDILETCRLPEPDEPRDCVLDDDAAWFAGLYIAEGSMSGDTIQITGHVKEVARWERVQRIAAKFAGYATMSENGNTQSIRVYGKVLRAILSELVTGRIAKNKGFATVVWRYSDSFIAAMLDGYLSGDGSWDECNNRWRLSFTRNYKLERDLRTACARLGYCLLLKLANVKYEGRRVPTFRGELRKNRSGHGNERSPSEVREIRKSRCRYSYDLGVEDEPHVFALASGVLTHNSKPNVTPESVKDRPTKAHEYIFLLTKSGQPIYWTHSDLPGTRRKPEPDYRWFHVDGRELDEKPVEEDWASQMVTCPECDGRGEKKVVFGTGLFGDITTTAVCERCEGDGEITAWKRDSLWTGHDYFYDQDAIREEQTGNAHPRCSPRRVGKRGVTPKSIAAEPEGTVKANPRFHEATSKTTIVPGGRNKRTVWKVPTRGYSGAHFATFPPKLIEPCILAGTSAAGCCPQCGAPWERVVKKPDFSNQPKRKQGKGVDGQMLSKGEGYMTSAGQDWQDWRDANPDRVLGWRPTCDCPGLDGDAPWPNMEMHPDGKANWPTVPCIVFDPFCGSGTAGEVALAHGREFVGLDLSRRYLRDLAAPRLQRPIQVKLL